MLAIFLVVLFGLIVTYLPIAFCLLITAVVLMALLTGGVNASVLAQNVVRGMDNFPLMAIPFFVLAGELMNVGGISKRIVYFAKALIGHIRGGLGYVTVLASMLFAGISGSAIADTTAIGSIMLPIMEEEGYDKKKSTALIISAGTIGPVIPPSVPMILYGVVAGVSVAKLFEGGIIPGILIGLGLMTVWSLHTRKNKEKYIPSKRCSAKELWKATREAFWAVLLTVIILGGILGGVFTATEAGAVAVFYALIVGFFVYKELKLKDLIPILINAAKSTATVMFVVGTATAAAYFITTAQIPAMLTNLMLSISRNPYIIMLMINILLLLVGCVMDLTPALLILAPILLPIVTAAGLDPVYFGVVMVCNLCIGIITPPVGTVLYVGCSLSKLSMAELIRPALSFIAIMVVVLFIITYIPQLVLLIPSLVS